jgi:tetratricopeptide (TPR) repeat protein
MLENYDKTIQDCYAVLKTDSKNPKVYLLRGKVCLTTESYGGASLFFAKTIKYSTNNDMLFEAYLNRGISLLKLNRFNESVSDLEQAALINENSHELLLSLSEAQYEMGNTIEASASIQKAIELDPEYAPSYKIYGDISRKTADFPKAISAYKQYIELDSNNVSAYNLLAELYLQTKQLEEGLEVLNRALFIDPKDPLLFKTYGLIYLEQDLHEKACNTFFRAMQMGYFERYDYDLLNIYLKECEK